METIFIGVTAYNEQDLLRTITNCLENASNPERVYFGVWAHYNDGSQPNLDIKNVKHILVNYPTLLGVCLGRLNALSMYDNQDYYLQIDAHMLFEKDWDNKVIESYKEIKKIYEKPIITTYVPWWSINEDGSINFYSPESDVLSGPMRYDANFFKEGYTRQETYNVDWSKNNFYEHYGFSAHFVFTSGNFINEVMPDPLIMFGGEEPTTAMRAWTRGYRIFAINHQIVWHKNKFHGVNYKNDRLKYIGEPEDSSHFFRKDISAKQRSRKILTGEILGYWGSPTLELLKEYEKYANIDFEKFYKQVDEWNNNA